MTDTTKARAARVAGGMGRNERKAALAVKVEYLTPFGLLVRKHLENER